MRSHCLDLSYAIRQKMLSHAELEYPRECCGVLYGSTGTDGKLVISVYESAPNECEEDRDCRFCLDPVELYKSEREFQKRGLEIMGLFHSHPDAPAAPSEEDERYIIPGLLYLIAGVEDGRSVEIRSWRSLSPGEAPEDVTVY